MNDIDEAIAKFAKLVDALSEIVDNETEDDFEISFGPEKQPPYKEEQETKTGRPAGATSLDELSAADAATLGAMWKDPLMYTSRYCTKWATDKLRKPIRRWQLAYRYGPRNSKAEDQ